MNTHFTQNKKYEYRIFDCFTFRDELDIVNYRLDTLKDNVDYFVVCEGDKEHLDGKPRERFLTQDLLYKLENEHNLKDRIFHYFADLKGSTNWERENDQRIQIYNKLKEVDSEILISELDRILISDADEIPNPNTLKELKNFDIVFFDQLYFVYYLNVYSGKNVTGTAACTWKKLKNLEDMYGGSCQWLRNRKDFGPEINNGGWHLSYFGGPKQVKKKANSIAEGDRKYTQKFFKEQIEEAKKNKTCPYSHRNLINIGTNKQQKGLNVSFLRNQKTFDSFQILDVYPDNIFDNLNKYSKLICKDF